MKAILLAMLPYALIAAGLFSIICSVKEYPFFVEHRKAQLITTIFGKTGMKIFYITIGVAIVVMGVLFLVVGIPVGEEGG